MEYLWMALIGGTAAFPHCLAIMAALGPGTLWAFLILGMGRHMLRAKWKRWGVVLAGGAMGAIGMWTTARKAGLLPPIPGLRMSYGR